jgi:antitoxin FitA
VAAVAQRRTIALRRTAALLFGGLALARCGERADPREGDPRFFTDRGVVDHYRAHVARLPAESGVRLRMCAACDCFLAMAKMIQIRNVPDEVHRKLKRRAKREGLTLSALLSREAERIANQPSLDDIFARSKRRQPGMSHPVDWAEVVREMRGE